MGNMLDALNSSGFSVSEEEDCRKYKSLNDIKPPFSVKKIENLLSNNSLSELTWGGSYKLIPGEDAVLGIANKLWGGGHVNKCRKLSEFEEGSGLFTVKGHNKVAVWLAHHRDIVYEVSNRCANVLDFAVEYCKTTATFRVLHMKDSWYRTDTESFGDESADYVIEYLEKWASKYLFIPLVLDMVVRDRIKAFYYPNGDRGSNYVFLGHNLLLRKDFEKTFEQWLSQGYMVNESVWYEVCKSKKLGHYLKRDSVHSPKIQQP